VIRRHDPLADPEPLIRRVYAYVAYRLGDGPEAEDVTSDTFERALRGRDTFDPSRGTAIGWLFGIARRCLAEAVEKRLLTMAEPPEQAWAGDLEERAVSRITLAEALATLDERDRDLVALRYGADLTAKRIGEIVGMETNAVEVALQRALARLRERLNAAEAPTTAPAPGAESVSVEP
jgi:RNA polymerase sigma-70 factor (ECF subfamily)